MSKTLKVTDGDVVRDRSTGLYETVTGKDKLNQDTKMTLSTDIRRDGIGCGLDSIVGADQADPVSAFSFAPVMFQFQQLVRNGLERLRQAQRKYQFSQRTTSELIYDFSPVTLSPDLADPRTVIWRVQISSVDARSSFALTGKYRS